MNVLLIAFIALLVQVPPSVQGVVLKVGTNEPIAKATVELRRSDGGEARTHTASHFKRRPIRNFGTYLPVSISFPLQKNRIYEGKLR